MRTIVLLTGLLALPVLAWSAEDTPQPPTLTVSATGTVQLAPDTAFVTLGMETAGQSLGGAQQQNAATMQKVMARLLQVGIEKDRIQTTSFTITPHYKPQPNRQLGEEGPAVPEITGYTVSQSMTVEVRDLEKVAKVIDSALAAGANHFQGLHWALREEHPARLRALKLAAVKAREKAHALSEALAVTLVRLIMVSEGGSSIMPPRPSEALEFRAAQQAAVSVPISAGAMNVEANVTLVYEIGRD